MESIRKPLISEKDRTKTYFDKRPEHYERALEKYDELYNKVGDIFNLHIQGVLVDVGGGGIINYNIDKVNHLILLDISFSKINDCRIHQIQGDCLHVGMKSNSVDTIIMQSLIHHLAEKDYNNTEKNIKNTFKEAYRVLKPNGKLLILENCPYEYIEKVERIVYGLLQIIYRFVEFPNVFVYSQNKIITELKLAGFKNILIEEISLKGKIPLLGVDIPERLVPMTISTFIANK
jgi:SAM-dependent methyltransferase